MVQKGEVQTCVVQKCEVQKCEVKGAKEQGAELRGAKVRGAKVRGAKVQGTKVQVGHIYSHVFVFRRENLERVFDLCWLIGAREIYGTCFPPGDYKTLNIQSLSDRGVTMG